MALSSTVLVELIKTKVEAATTYEMPALSQTVWTAIAEAIVEHITTAGVVAVTITSVSGVTTGGGVSGPGTGTGTIT